MISYDHNKHNPDPMGFGHGRLLGHKKIKNKNKNKHNPDWCPPWSVN